MAGETNLYKLNAGVYENVTQTAHIADPAAAAALTQEAMTDNTGGAAATAVPAFSSPPTKAECDNFAASVLAQLAKIKTDVAAVRTASEANRTAVVAVLAGLETQGLNATS